MNRFHTTDGDLCRFRAEAVRSQLARDDAAPRGKRERSDSEDEQRNDDLDERAARLTRDGHNAILRRTLAGRTLESGAHNKKPAKKEGSVFRRSLLYRLDQPNQVQVITPLVIWQVFEVCV
jgi:hypothetical protein